MAEPADGSGASDGRYRPCVGVAVFNREGLVFVGRRVLVPPIDEPGTGWQMPQGGIDPGEMPLQAARRELFEETSIRSVALLGESEKWLSYDIPPEFLGIAWGGRYRGQRQKWFAFRFEGEDSEIDVERPGGGRHEREFEDWRWERLDRVAELIVPFKRPVYIEVAETFAQFARPVATAEVEALGRRR
jgi:putative (di)nucleoside polyphosphate hydrolase